MGIPIYMQIQQYIKEQISSGEWIPGFLIPPESELSKQFGCSRITVTTALRELVKDGVIFRIQGKGTYVSQRSSPENIYQESGLAQVSITLDALSIPGEHKCLSCKTERPSVEVAEILRLGPEQQVIAIERMKYVEGTPFSAERMYLPRLLFLPVLENHLEDQHFDKISAVCGVTTGKSYVSSEPVLCDDGVGEMLGIPAGTPILRFCIEIYDTQERPVTCEMVYTPGRQHKIQLP